MPRGGTTALHLGQRRCSRIRSPGFGNEITAQRSFGLLSVNRFSLEARFRHLLQVSKEVRVGRSRSTATYLDPRQRYLLKSGPA
jgi:hypothetical protein